MIAAKAGDFVTAEQQLTSYENHFSAIDPVRKQPMDCSRAMIGFWRAWCLRLQGEFDRAFELLTQYEKEATQPELELFECEKLRIHLSSGHQEQAATALAKFMSKLDTATHPDEICLVAAEISSQLEQYDQTQLFLDQCSDQDERKQVMSALLAFYQSDFESAKKYLSTVIGTDCLNLSLKQELLEAMANDN